MFRILTILAASSAALIALALPASASSAAPTAIKNFASSVATVTYQQPVTFTGELVEGPDKIPVANEPVQIQFQPPAGAFTTVATGTTAADGQFTISTPLPSGGLARAAFAGDASMDPSYSQPGYGLLLDAAQLPSRLVIDAFPASVPAGTAIDFSGTIQVQVDGTWEPFQGAQLALTMEPYTSSQPNASYATTSGPGGQFSLTEPVTETSEWSIDTSLDGDYWADWIPDYARADYGWIYGVSKTEVVGFHVPAKAEAQIAARKGLYATGTVDRWDGSSWVGLAYGWVDFYYRPKGSTVWHQGGGAQANAFGQFKGLAGVHLGTANWQARVQSAADTLTSTSTNTVISSITDRTNFASVSIQHGSSGSPISGQITDVYEDESFSSLRGLTLHLYYRSDHSKSWHYYKATKVGRGGYFSFSEAKRYGFHFKVVLPAQGPYLSCTSRTL